MYVLRLSIDGGTLVVSLMHCRSRAQNSGCDKVGISAWFVKTLELRIRLVLLSFHFEFFNSIFTMD